MLEKEVEKYLVDRVTAVGGQTRKLRWIGRRGAPDRLIFGPNVAPCFVELKRPDGGELSKQQITEIAHLRAGGLDVFVISNHAEVDELMKWAVKQ